MVAASPGPQSDSKGISPATPKEDGRLFPNRTSCDGQMQNIWAADLDGGEEEKESIQMRRCQSNMGLDKVDVWDCMVRV